jgi:hypothetical protein
VKWNGTGPEPQWNNIETMLRRANASIRHLEQHCERLVAVLEVIQGELGPTLRPELRIQITKALGNRGRLATTGLPPTGRRAKLRIIRPSETAHYEVRPANGSLSDIENQEFIGVQIGVLDDGTWAVEVDGLMPDLAKAVFRRGEPPRRAALPSLPASLTAPPLQGSTVAPDEQENPDRRDIDGNWKDRS